jgi:hypothetical protein
VYLKPPLGNLYQSRKPISKHSFISVSGSQQVTLNNDVSKGNATFNPYATWHGSGKAHINGYNSQSLEQEHVLKDSKTVSLSEVAISPHILFTGIFPLNTRSYIKTTPPPDDYDGNYIEVSDNPFRQNEVGKTNTTAHLVLDLAILRQGSVVMDVMVHNRGVDFDIERNHPYPQNSEMYFVAPPLKIMPYNSLCPAVTVFFYQPVDDEDKKQPVEKQPSTIWIRSKGASEEQFIQFEPI